MSNVFHIQRLGHQGDGIADGPIFAPRTLPGEEVSGTLDGTRLSDVRILTPSPDRVQPPCPHARSCGGCQLQHASDGFVTSWKRDVVAAALAAQGLTAEFLPVQVSPARSRRRATISARRTKKGALAGFHARASDTVVDVPNCHLLRPDLVAVLPIAAALAQIGSSRKAELSVTLTDSPEGADVAVSGGKPLDDTLRLSLAQLAEQRKLARLTWDGETVAMRAPPFQQFGRARVVPPPGAFLQATAQGEAALLTHVRRVVGSARRVVDLFAGCGTFALPLAETAEVLAVEADAAMIDALDAGWRGTKGLKKVNSETRDLFRNPLLADEFSRFDAVVLDPPRAGAEAQIAHLAQARVPVIAHVSCNPATFARDAATLLAAGYTMGPIQVVDQFRWSTHVELAAGFTFA